MNGYSVFDKKTQRYERPFFSPHDVDVLRSLKNLPEGHNYKLFPEDFNVQKIGSFDPETGRFVSLDVFVVILEFNSIFEKDMNVVHMGLERKPK